VVPNLITTFASPVDCYQSVCEEEEETKTERCGVCCRAYSPTESPQMQLPIERSNLSLIEKHGNNLIHKFVLIQYPERSSMRQPRDCLGKLEIIVREFEDSVELNREFRLRLPCGAQARVFWCGASIGLHFVHPVWLLVMMMALFGSSL